MKFLLFGMLSAATFLSACDTGATQETAKTDTGATPSVASIAPPATASTASPIQGIITGYLQLKNALTTDNGNAAAEAGAQILTALSKVDTAAMTNSQRVTYNTVSGDVKEHAEHISTNAGKIKHQREHFVMLSKDVEDLVKTFGGGQTLYKDFCPMASDGKGAAWLSEVKDIKNPYYGSEMLECGEVKETLK